MQALPTWTTEDHPCEYLPDRRARMQCAFAAEMTPTAYEDRLNAGWRKFGRVLFRPVCRACRACQSLRMPAERFTPNRSRQRTLRANAHLTVAFGPPQYDTERLALYNRYHAAQEQRRGWSPSVKTKEEYRFSFLENPIPSVEITVRDGDVLRALVLTDITPSIVSAVYHFHDPDLFGSGVGTFALLQTIALARRLGKPYVHFGYYVADCPSLAYKATFQPCEILHPDGVWRDFSEPSVLDKTRVQAENGASVVKGEI